MNLLTYRFKMGIIGRPEFKLMPPFINPGWFDFSSLKSFALFASASREGRRPSGDVGFASAPNGLSV